MTTEQLNRIANERRKRIESNKERLFKIKHSLNLSSDDIKWLIDMADDKITNDESDLYDPYSY